MWHNRKGERAKERRGKGKKEKREKEKRKKREKREKKRRKEKPSDSKESNGKGRCCCVVRGAFRAGEELWGLPLPQKDGWACCPWPIAAAAYQVMFIALK